ncbi:MAG: class I SAM-dependent methyltransferase, partial [Terriglobia bacterium]
MADVQNPPFPNASFHAVTFTDSFANFPDLLPEFARVTRPSGEIGIINVIAPRGPAENRRLNGLESRRHIYTRLMTREQFDELVQTAGLELMRCPSLRPWLPLSPAIERDSNRRVFGLVPPRANYSGGWTAGRHSTSSPTSQAGFCSAGVLSPA